MRFTSSKPTERPRPQTVEERNAALAALEAEQHSARPAAAYTTQQRHSQQQQFSEPNPYNQPGAAAADAPLLTTTSLTQNSRNVTRSGVGDRMQDEQQNNSDDEEARTSKAARQAVRGVYGSEREYAEALKRARGFDIVPMGEDGACLFRAVAYHVYADQEMHNVVRTNCLDYMVSTQCILYT